MPLHVCTLFRAKVVYGIWCCLTVIFKIMIETRILKAPLAGGLHTVKHWCMHVSETTEGGYQNTHMYHSCLHTFSHVFRISQSGVSLRLSAPQVVDGIGFPDKDILSQHRQTHLEENIDSLVLMCCGDKLESQGDLVSYLSKGTVLQRFLLGQLDPMSVTQPQLSLMISLWVLFCPWFWFTLPD